MADSLWLDNGERLSGEIPLHDSGKPAWTTHHAGQVPIDWKDIGSPSSDKPLILRRQGLAAWPGPGRFDGAFADRRRDRLVVGAERVS